MAGRPGEAFDAERSPTAMTSHHDSAPTAAAAAGPRPFPFNIWLRAVGAAVDLTHAQRSVLTHMATYATWDTGRDVRPGLDLITANMHGATKGGVSKSIDALQAAGWLILVSPASKGRGRAAEYRLGIGEFDRFQGDDALIAWTSGKVADPATFDGQKVAIQTKKVAILTEEGCNPDNPPLSTSQYLSSSSPAPEPIDAPNAIGEEQREIEGFSDEKTNPRADITFQALMVFWPNKGCRRGTARENALAQIETTLNKGIDTADLVDAARDAVRSGDVDSRTWLNAWVAAWEKTNATVAQVSARFTREARIHACTLCDEYGFINAVDQRGIRTSSRCTHPDVDDTAVSAEAPRRTREFTQRTEQYIDPTNPWKTAPLITSDDYDAYRDAPRPSGHTFHDDGDDYAPPAGWGIGA